MSEAAPQDQQDTSQQPDGAGRDDGKATEDVSGLKSALKQERDARKTAEKSLSDLQARIDALEAKDKTDVERLQGERDKLKADLESRETRLRDMAIRTALIGAATKAGARYPELIVDRLSAKADLDDDLNVTNADALVTAAKREYPDLFRVVDGKADGGKTDGGTDTSQLRGTSRLAYAHSQRSRS